MKYAAEDNNVLAPEKLLNKYRMLKEASMVYFPHILLSGVGDWDCFENMLFLPPLSTILYYNYWT